MAMASRGLLGQYAGFVTRAAAIIIDIIVVSVSVIVINWLVAQPLVFFTGVDAGACIVSPADYGSLLGLMCRLLGLTWTTVTLTASPIYFIFFFAAYGQTIGKYMMGVRVVRVDGSPMTYKSAIVRWLGYFVSVFTIGLGFLWVIVDERRQGFHDRIAGTTVVYAWRARQNEFFLDRVRRWFMKHPSLSNESARRVATNPHVDLITIAVPSRNIVRKVMGMLQNGVTHGDFDVINVSVLVTDHKGQLGIFGVSDLSVGPEEFNVLDVKGELPPAQEAEIRADLPPDSFIVAILLHESWGDEVVNLISRHAAAVIRRYDMGTADKENSATAAPLNPLELDPEPEPNPDTGAEPETDPEKVDEP